MTQNQEQHVGHVVAFDFHAGLGEIRDEQGRVWPFHCVSLSDGSRSIDIGTHVKFIVRFHVQRDEAFDITPTIHSNP
ncbi:unannotated protein [freshwater metagenome]|uniref:Unannotated protein n=1 Tax=freshwater metagenome TaxID=449393 RepID=A0A6J6M239_9ZZZZ